MLYMQKGNNIDVDIVNNTPYIKIDLKFTGRIYSMKENSKYLNSESLNDISNTANLYLENILTDYLYKTSTEFRSDINDIGKYCLSNFLTIDEFNEFDWEESYKNSSFKVSVDTNIESSSLLIET